MLCLAAAGCASVGSSLSQALGPSVQGRNVSIAFESIDGLAYDGQAALVRDLNEEASTFHIAIVPNSGDAWYRIRGYVATRAERRSTAVMWAWDVYDSGRQRAVRLRGEERSDAPAGKGGAIADEALLRRIARAGMAQLADFMATTPPAASPPSPPPVRSGSDMASRDDAPIGSSTQVAAWRQ